MFTKFPKILLRSEPSFCVDDNKRIDIKSVCLD